MDGYRTRDAAALLEMHVGQVRACAREGILDARRGPRGEYRLSFQDMVVLRAARSLMRGFPAARVRRVFSRIRRGLPERQLASLRIIADRDVILVQDGALLWEPESGQTRFNFESDERESAVMPILGAPEESDPVDAETAGAWFQIAVDLEESDADEAIAAYRRAIELDEALYDARINLGRLCHAKGDLGTAEFQYRKALEFNPESATASFNLGVVLEDLNRSTDAIRAYERALELDPEFADPHYNLYRIHERLGRFDRAIRHLQAYRDLDGN